MYLYIWTCNIFPVTSRRHNIHLIAMTMTNTNTGPAFLKDASLWIQAALVDDKWTSLPNHETFEIRSE